MVYYKTIIVTMLYVGEFTFRGSRSLGWCITMSIALLSLTGCWSLNNMDRYNSLTAGSSGSGFSALTLTSPSPTRNPLLTFTASSCSGVSAIVVRESATTPSLTDSDWQTCSTSANAISYLLTGTTQGTRTLYAWGKDSGGTISPRSAAINVVFDDVAPAFSFGAFPATVISGTQDIAISLTEANVSSTQSIAVAYSINNGTTWTADNGLPVGVNGPLSAQALTYSWAVPANVNTVQALFRLTLTDLAGNTGTSTSAAFTIDSTPPAAPSVTLTSAAITNSTAVTMTVASCVDRTQLLVNEGTQPAITDAGWVACSTTASALTYTLPATPEGTRTLRVWARDSVGNVSATAATVSLTYDATAPQITLGSLPDPLPQGVAVAVGWTATEPRADTSLNFTIEARDTPANPIWTNIGTVASTAGPLTAASFSINWTIPAWITSTAELRVRFTDLAGNPGSATATGLAISNLAPVATLSSIASPILGGATRSITIDASTASGTLDNVVLEYAEDGVTYSNLNSWTGLAGATFNTTYTWTTPAATTNAARVRVKATNTVPSTGTTTSPALIIDSTPPTLVASNFTINSGATTTQNNNVSLQLKASSSASNVTQVCAKGTATAPLGTDSCWVPVSSGGGTASTLVTITNLPYAFTFGFLPGTFNVYAWAKNEVGLISSLTASGAGTNAQDKASISYIFPQPPVITNALAVGSDTPSSPPTDADVTVSAGGTVYIKWNATSPIGMPATPVKLEYSTDESNWLLIANNLANASNGGCSIDGSTYTGCYSWISGSPVGSVYRVRITASSNDGSTSKLTTNPINALPIKIIAGNANVGFNSSAVSAIFQGRAVSTFPYGIPLGIFTVTSTGRIFFLSDRDGIISVDPNDKLFTLLIRTTGTATGDGGAATNATLCKPIRIAVDPQDRLLIFDCDRIRRVDFSTNPAIIDTVIGGGAITTNDTPALQYKVVSSGLTSPYDRGHLSGMPNGDIYFGNNVNTSGTPNLRVYRASTSRVYDILPNGTGTAHSPATDLSTLTYYWGAMAFEYDITTGVPSKAIGIANELDAPYVRQYLFFMNPTTWTAFGSPPAIAGPSNLRQGNDGHVYYATSTTIYRWNDAGNSWTAIAGTGAPICEDGMLVSACRFNLSDFWVTQQGQLYVFSTGRVQAVDQSQGGKVATLYGQRLLYGDGGPATNARFNDIRGFGTYNTGADGDHVVISDFNENRHRDFKIGGNIVNLAGTDSGAAFSTAADPTTVGLGNYISPVPITDPATGAIYVQYNQTGIYRLNRDPNPVNNRWSLIMGGGATIYYDPAADGMAGELLARQYVPMPIGFDGNGVLAHQQAFTSPNVKNSMFKLYDKTTRVQSHVAGALVNVSGEDWPAASTDGTSSASAALPQYDSWALWIPPMQWDSLGNQWLVWQRSAGGYKWVKSIVPGGTVTTLATVSHGIDAVAYVRDASLTRNDLFYCSGTTHQIRKKDLNTGIETALTWSVPTMECMPMSMTYNASRNSLIFIYRQNGLMGIAEYQNP